MSFGNFSSFVPFLVAVKISWWRYQFKSPQICNIVSRKSQFHLVFLWMLFLLYFHNYHKNFMWICENGTRFLSLDVIWYVDWFSNPFAYCLLTDIFSNFNVFLLGLFKDIVILNYCLNVFLKMNVFFSLSILLFSFFWGSSHQVNLTFLSQDYKCFDSILCWFLYSFETEILVIWHE